MIEWLDGYWTAMRHVANAAPQALEERHPVEWISAIGSAGAAIAAAVAAGLSWSSAKQNRKVADKAAEDFFISEQIRVENMTRDTIISIQKRVAINNDACSSAISSLPDVTGHKNFEDIASRITNIRAAPAKQLALVRSQGSNVDTSTAATIADLRNIEAAIASAERESIYIELDMALDIKILQMLIKEK